MTAYCTPGDVRDAARLDIASTSMDAGITQLIAAVSQRLDQLHNLPAGGFAVAADTTRYYGYDAIHRGRLHLDAPCLSVTTLTNGDTVIIPSNAYRLHPRNEPRKHTIELVSSAGYAWGFYDDGEIIVVGKFGYSLTVPDNVAEACAMWAGWLLKRYQSALQDATANQEMGQLVYSESIPKQVLALLRPRGPSL
jgi:hypothetical protein